MTQIHRMRSALLAAGIGIAAIAPAMANDIFLNIPGVVGESQSAAFPGDIQLTAYSQEFTDPATIASLGGGRGGAGNRTTCGAITITKLVDSTSPNFLQFVTRGELINNATIYFVGKPVNNASSAPYTIALMRVRVTSITQGDTAPNSAAGFGITETISMIAERFHFSFLKQNSDGGAATVEKYGWDCLTKRQL